MEEIKCGILQSEVLFKSYYVINAEILEGRFSSPVGMVTDGIRINEFRITTPVSLVKLSTGFKEQIKLYVDLQLCSDDERRILANAKSGTILMQAPDLEVSLQGNKHLLFIGDSGVLQAFSAILALARSGGQVEVYSMHRMGKAALNALRSYVKRMDFPLRSIRGGGDRSIAHILEAQTVGTRIMAFCDWSDYSRIKHMARRIGYSNMEIQGIGIGEKHERVFCARCYQMQHKPQESEIICMQCGIPLVISNHYSPRLEAYMGYVNVN